MKLKFEIWVELERERGKFSTKDSLADEVYESLENADPDTLYGDGEEAKYTVISWEVNRTA